MTQGPVVRSVEFGSTGERVSSIGYGAAGLGNVYGDLDDATAHRSVRLAFERGITFFDTSAYYGEGLSETRLGSALAGIRDEVFLATKGGRLGADRFDFSFAGVLSHCDDSLRRLGTDRIDLYQLHDIEFGEEEMVVNEGVAALHELRRQGKVRFLGVTGYPTALLQRVVQQADLDAVLSYCHGNVMDRSMLRSLVPAARARGMATINASVTHMGLLTAQGPPAWHPAPPRVRAAARRVVDACVGRGVAVSDVAVAFAAALADVTVTLLGANTPELVEASLAAIERGIDGDVLAAVQAALGDDADVSWPSGLARYDEYAPGSPGAADSTESTP